MPNGDDKLREKLKPFTDSLQSRISTRASIINNFVLLDSLKREGYKIIDLIEISGCTYSRQSFSDALCEGKKRNAKMELKKSEKKENPKRLTGIPNESIDQPSIIDEQKNSKLKQPLREWKIQTGIDIPERQALRLEALGIDTNELVKHNFITTSQINKYLTQLDINNKHKEQK